MLSKTSPALPTSSLASTPEMEGGQEERPCRGRAPLLMTCPWKQTAREDEILHSHVSPSGSKGAELREGFTSGIHPTSIRVLTLTLPLSPQEMSVGYANGIRVMSMTHTGEPGFMLYIPIEVSSTEGRGAGCPTPCWALAGLQSRV